MKILLTLKNRAVTLVIINDIMPKSVSHEDIIVG